MTISRNTLRALTTSLLLVGLIVAACSPAKSTALPTQKPAATKAAPTQAPVTNPTTKPQPTAQPTSKPKPTAQPTAQPTQAETSKVVPLGTAQTVGALSIMPSKFDILFESGQDKPKAGEEFVVVNVSIENTDQKASIDFDPAQLLLSSGAGADFTMVSLKSLTNALKAETLKPGQKLEGVIAFEVPQKESKWELHFEGGNGHDLYWSLTR